MAVPKRKTSPSVRNMRRSHSGLIRRQLQECPECGEPNLAHQLCRKCGTYRQRQVIELSQDD